MPKSMTGFGRAKVENDQYALSMELKSVNSRYFDLTIKCPAAFAPWENTWRRKIQEEITRGKVELRVNFRQLKEDSQRILLDKPLLQAYAHAYREVYKFLGEETRSLAPALIRRDDLFSLDETLQDEALVRELADSTLEQCLADFARMRAAEGSYLADDLQERLGTMAGLREKVAAKADSVPEAYRQKLMRRVEEILELDQEEFYDGQRVAAEVALYADKCDVTEELVRLEAHFQQFKSTLAQNGPCGKKLDFIVQEMNREANTLASKAQDLSMVEAAVELKSQIEQLREQIQNLE